MKYALFILLAFGIANAFLDTHIHNHDADISDYEKSKSKKEAEALEEKIDFYIERFDTDKSWALALIDFSQAQKKSILRVYADYYRERCPDNVLTNAEMDFKTIKMLKEIGFKNKGSIWTYEGQKVNVGISRKGKIDRKRIPEDLFFDAKAVITKDKSILIKVRTNLPDENYLKLTVSNIDHPEQIYKIDSVYVRNGYMEMELFLPVITKGTYALDISDPYEMGLPPSDIFNMLSTCGRFTRSNAMFPRKIIEMSQKKILYIKKDIINKNTTSTGFRVRKNDRIKHIIQYDADLVDNRDEEQIVKVKIWFGLAEETKIVKVKSSKKYKTVKIGKNVWMAENLNHATHNSYCYNDSMANCEKYGRLYNWETAVSVCPDGWRLPSKEDFEDLIASVEDGRSVYLKASTDWLYDKGNDEYGFRALPAGEYYTTEKGETLIQRKKIVDRTFRRLGETAFIWSSTETKYQSNYEPEAYNLWITNHSFRRYEEVSIDRSKKSHYLSVRCVKKRFFLNDAGTPIYYN